MADTPLTEADLKRIENYYGETIPCIPALVAEVRRLRADLEQAARDFRMIRNEDPNYRACEPPWVNRVREREGKNG